MFMCKVITIFLFFDKSARHYLKVVWVLPLRLEGGSLRSLIKSTTVCFVTLINHWKTKFYLCSSIIPKLADRHNVLYHSPNLPHISKIIKIHQKKSSGKTNSYLNLKCRIIHSNHWITFLCKTKPNFDS